MATSTSLVDGKMYRNQFDIDCSSPVILLYPFSYSHSYSPLSIPLHSVRRMQFFELFAFFPSLVQQLRCRSSFFSLCRLFNFQFQQYFSYKCAYCIVFLHFNVVRLGFTMHKILGATAARSFAGSGYLDIFNWSKISAWHSHKKNGGPSTTIKT